jgi:hypothetical protein
MRQATCWIVASAASLVAVTGSAAAAVPEQIGSWVLDCPGREPCLMRLGKRFFQKGNITGDLEVQARGKSLVPVIILRGLSTDLLTAATSMGAKAAATVQFGGGPREELTCAASNAGYFCSPNDASAQKLATGLQAAQSVTVRVAVSMAGMNPLPAQEQTRDLSGTKEALARLRAAGPAQIPSPMSASGPQPPGAMPNGGPGGMMAMADKALKAAGYQNGMADLQAMMAKYMKK